VGRRVSFATFAGSAAGEGWEVLAVFAACCALSLFLLFGNPQHRDVHGRFVPLNETTAVAAAGNWSGASAEAMSGWTSMSFGLAVVRDGRGDLHQVPAAWERSLRREQCAGEAWSHMGRKDATVFSEAVWVRL